MEEQIKALIQKYEGMELENKELCRVQDYLSAEWYKYSAIQSTLALAISDLKQLSNNY